jgi:hypothetical protein
MGNNILKKKKTEINTQIGKSFSCPLCDKHFKDITTFNDLNIHIKLCSKNPKQSKLKITKNNKESILNREKTFEQKLQRLRSNLECMKIDWREAHCNMELNREKILEESIQNFPKLDPYKELKINFKGEVSYDAGGIIREWFTVLVKELESSKLSKYLLKMFRFI